MRINAAGLDLLKKFEGCELMPYKDSAGLLTIGYGHLLTQNDSSLLGGITMEEAESILKDDVRFAERAVEKWVDVAMNENQFSALVCLVFNIGAGAFSTSTLRKHFNSGLPWKAADQFLEWDKVTKDGKKVKSPGLVRRRRAERELFIKPLVVVEH